MNSKGEENRSVRLTRKRLSDALITLLMQNRCGKSPYGS